MKLSTNRFEVHDTVLVDAREALERAGFYLAQVGEQRFQVKRIPALIRETHQTEETLQR